MADPYSIMMDGVEIPIPRGKDMEKFISWVHKNEIRDPFHPDQHYDYVGAWRSGMERDPETKHFFDTYKLPGHPTFSIDREEGYTNEYMK